jgi:hypothetical protein
MRIYSLIFALTLFSCSSNYHYQKALKKGLKPIISSDTIRVATIDSIPVIYRDSIIYERYFSSKDTVIKYENVYIPKTRLEIRTEYKIQRDTIRMTRVVEKARAKASAPKSVNWTLIIIVISLLLSALMYLKSK